MRAPELLASVPAVLYPGVSLPASGPGVRLKWASDCTCLGQREGRAGSEGPESRRTLCETPGLQQEAQKWPMEDPLREQEAAHHRCWAMQDPQPPDPLENLSY